MFQVIKQIKTHKAFKMHLPATALAAFAATSARQAPRIASISGTFALNRRTTSSQPPLSYKPLFSIVQNRSTQTWCNKYGLPTITPKRFANTTSGSFAPSTMISSQRSPCANREAASVSTVFQDSEHLPHLPLPELTQTLEKLKESISPVAMNSAEFAKALELIDEFGQSAGSKLDSILREKASKTKNWITHDWWVREVYLKSRQPLVINSNPAMIYPEFPFEVNNQRALITVTAELISGLIDYKLSLAQGYNPEATSEATEYRLDSSLCYDQYRRIFGSTRMPGDPYDKVVVKSDMGAARQQDAADSSNAHGDSAKLSIVVSYRGNFFELQLTAIAHDDKSRINQLTSILDEIISTTATTNDSVGNSNSAELKCAGVFTTARRDNWATTIKLLDSDSIKSIQEAEFVVCLDTVTEPPIDNIAVNSDVAAPSEQQFSSSLLASAQGTDKHAAALGRQILHGDCDNVGNRWFDKAVQLIVVANERFDKLLGAGINYEHSFAEAAVISKAIEFSFDKTVQRHRQSSSNTNSGDFFAPKHIASVGDATSFRRLRMFDESTNGELLANELKKSHQDFRSQINQFDLSFLKYKQYGSNAIKSWRFSPDSWFQVALQIAYHNVHNRLGVCYESASTRRFAYGRTETIRSLTKEVAEFCMDPNYETLRAAVNSHKSYANAANNGEAIDRALMGYKMTYNELKRGTWSWGLPEHLAQTEQQVAALPLDDCDVNEQNESLHKVFNENELNVIGAFLNNELIRRSQRFALSTSQVSSIYSDIYMCYGPLLADGYGVCYNLTGQQIVAAITANSSNQSFSCEVAHLNQNLQRALDSMRNIVEANQAKK